MQRLHLIVVVEKKMTAYFYSISQHFTIVDKNPYNGEKLMCSMLCSLDQDIKHDHSTARSVTLGPKNVPSDGPGQIHRFSRWAGNFHSLLTQWERVQESHPLTKSATKTNKKWPQSGKQNVSQELLAQFKFFFERFLNVCLKKPDIFREISFR